LFIRAEWDEEAGVWVATSDDVPGLATEAETLELLSTKLETLVPNCWMPMAIQMAPKFLLNCWQESLPSPTGSSADGWQL
jgi:hypothetical protein